MQYILASASPRRRELLARIIGDFKIIPAEGEEKADRTLPPEEIAKALASCKCDEVFDRNPDCTVIGCDTIVCFDGEILGKPKSRGDAYDTLKRLSGKTHFVITGVCVRSPNKKLCSFAKTEVTFNRLDDEFIKIYVQGGSPLDKAGSYGIQDEGIVKEFYGSYTNVVGLPVTLVKNMLDEIKKYD